MVAVPSPRIIPRRLIERGRGPERFPVEHVHAPTLVSLEMACAKSQKIAALKRLQILNDRPTLIFGKAGPIFVPAIAVAVRIIRIGHEIGVLKR
jgi:hypothetical protein